MKRFIGDIHGNYEAWIALHGVYPTVQVGDFGIGFKSNPTDTYDVEDNDFIRGNHDHPDMVKFEPNWIPDGHFEDGIFYVGGARSTDQHRRTKDVDWWEDEELSHENWWAILDKYEKDKPSIVVSHDGPEPVIHYIKGYWDWNTSRTQQALTSMLHIHKPKLWIFGHYHKPYDDTIDGCRFICLDINEHIDIDVDAIVGIQE